MAISNRAQAVETLTFSPELPVAFRSYLLSSLEMLFSVEGAGGSPLHRKIFAGPVDGQVYRDWFEARVRKIVLVKDDCSFTARIDSEGEVGVMLISSCANLSPDPENRFYWLSVLFHEARHMEAQNGYWKHRVCLDELSGMASACDDSPLSAYGLEKVLAANIVSHCQNCTSDFKSQAQEIYDFEANWRKLSPTAEKAIRRDSQNKNALNQK